MQIFFDGHNDTFTKIYPPRHMQMPKEAPHAFLTGSSRSHLDLPRALKAGYAGAFFAIFVDPVPEEASLSSSKVYVSRKRHTDPNSCPPSEAPVDSSLALKATLEVMSSIFRDERASEGRFAIVRTPSQLERAIDDGRLAAIMHIEGCEAVDVNLENLETLYQAGVRSLGVCWSRPNIFGTGVPFAYNISPDIGPGLTNAGRRLVEYCDEMGIIVDSAHLNAQGFFDIASISSKPLVVTHSSAFSLSPSSRGLTDEQLDTVAQSGGVVGVTFNVPDLAGPTGNDAQSIARKVNIGERENPDEPLSEIEALAAHILYIGRRIGFEHTAIGSDFDGCLIPDEIKDVCDLHKLVEILKNAGLSSRELDCVCCKNWLRVIGQTLKD